MKKTIKYIFDSWQSLKYWFDPAMEGNPYEKDADEEKQLFLFEQSLIKKLVRS